MPPASRITCSVPGCVSGPIPEGSDTPGPYITHVECTTRADVKEDLREHVNMVHELPLKHQQVEAQKYQAETDRLRLTPKPLEDEIEHEDVQNTANKQRSKLETIPRPKIQPNATQSDWSFFVAQWERCVLE